MSRRGLSNEDRFALDTRAASATSTVASGPLYLYDIFCSTTDTNSTGEVALSSVTATAAADFGLAAFQIMRVKLGAGGASAGGTGIHRRYSKPVFVARDVGVSSTNAFVSISYFPAP